MGRIKNKQVKFKENYKAKRQTKLSPETKKHKFLWTYRFFDEYGPFNGTQEKITLEEVYKKQRDLENLNFSELGKQGSHSVLANSLVREAQKKIRRFKIR